MLWRFRHFFELETVVLGLCRRLGMTAYYIGLLLGNARTCATSDKCACFRPSADSCFDVGIMRIIILSRVLDWTPERFVCLAAVQIVTSVRVAVS